MGLAKGQIKRVIDRSFPREQVAHLLAVAMSFFGVLGISGMYARQVAAAKWVSTGLAGLCALV